MKILLVGGGVVGTATGLGFQRLGHEITVLDLASDCMSAKAGLRVVTEINFKTEYPSPDIVKLPESWDIVLFCVPEKVIDDAVLPLAPIGESVPFYIRSSVPPGTCARLQKEFGRHFGHNPEFLREAVAEYEFMNPPAIILGDCCGGHGMVMAELYKPFRVPIHLTTPEVSEFTKLAVNAYLADQISFWNQVKLLADKLGINSHEVGMLATFGDDRVSTYGARMHGKPYGGKCLPKDLEQLLNLCKKFSVKAPLFNAVKEINELFMRGG